ncbi:MAG: hypothetical protein ABSA67_09850 [Candidatus Brocadiia bacterium]|jgi:hypothetical protein
MKKLRLALVAVMMAAGLAFAAGDARIPPSRRANDFDATRLPLLIVWNDQLIARWQELSGPLHTDEAKKVFGDAIAKAKEFRAGLGQLTEAYKAGQDDEAARLTDQLREKRLPLAQYAATLPTYAEIDQAEALQVERGRDNADLDARYQRIIDLLNKRLELQNQVGAVNREIFKERQALQQSIQAAPANAPAAEPAKP